ncbi:MAG: alpha/beta fold hydrolase [Clostridia bacterium]|nr:alpha/beta fold hydrolase [Clostridia bacterium]
MTEELRIPGSLGDIYGILTVPDGVGPVPLVILSHGFGGNHRGHQDYADYFVARGFATFNFDFCGGGDESKSAGTMMEMTVLTEAEDLSAIIDRFQADDRFSCICLWGASQGGFVSALVSARRPEAVRAVVLEYPAIVLQDDARERANPDGTFPATSRVMRWTISHRYNEAAVSFDLYEQIRNYTGPVLILHGDRDRIVPLRYSERARDVYAHAELVVLPGQDHGFIGQSRTEAMIREAEFLEAHSR